MPLASPPADSWQLSSQPAVPPETGPGQRRPLGAGSGQTEAAAHPQPDERSVRGREEGRERAGREEKEGKGGWLREREREKRGREESKHNLRSTGLKGGRERRERGRRGLESLLNALTHLLVSGLQLQLQLNPVR